MSNTYKQILLFILVLFLVIVAFLTPLMKAMASSNKVKDNNTGISIYPQGLDNEK